MTEPVAHGGCLCGAVRFSVAGPLRDVLICHCAECRRWTGAPGTFTARGRERLVFDDERGLRGSTALPATPTRGAGSVPSADRACSGTRPAATTSRSPPARWTETRACASPRTGTPARRATGMSCLTTACRGTSSPPRPRASGLRPGYGTPRMRSSSEKIASPAVSRRRFARPNSRAAGPATRRPRARTTAAVLGARARPHRPSRRGRIATTSGGARAPHCRKVPYRN